MATLEIFGAFLYFNASFNATEINLNAYDYASFALADIHRPDYLNVFQFVPYGGLGGVNFNILNLYGVIIFIVLVMIVVPI